MHPSSECYCAIVSHPCLLSSYGCCIIKNTDDNNLNGTLPSELGSLPSLRALLLDSNENIQGTIPESFKELSNLTFLDLDNNTLSGTIPEFLYGLSALLAVDLNYNDFSGTISSQISQLSNLNFLDLSDNFFNGTIPDVINNMTSLSKSASAVLSRCYCKKYTPTIFDMDVLCQKSFASFNLCAAYYLICTQINWLFTKMNLQGQSPTFPV